MLFPQYPGYPLKKGDEGENVQIIQDCLDYIFTKYPLSDNICSEQNFGIKTHSAVKSFQKVVNLDDDGIVGEKTWNAILTMANFFSNS